MLPVGSLQVFVIKVIRGSILRSRTQVSKFSDCQSLFDNVDPVIESLSSFKSLLNRTGNNHVQYFWVIVPSSPWFPFGRRDDLCQSCQMSSFGLHILNISRKVLHLFKCWVENLNLRESLSPNTFS